MSISPAYRKLLQEQRRLTPKWGNASRHAAPVVNELNNYGLVEARVLDYGAGTGAFKRTVEERTGGRIRVDSYEPGDPECAILQSYLYDAVVCTHVLEHVEPDLLSATVDEILERARLIVYIEVPHGPANKLLPDGRDAHLTQQSRTWWHEFLALKMCPHWAIEVRPGLNPINTQFIGRLPYGTK